MGDQMRKGLFTGFSEVDFVSSPEGTPLFAQESFRIVRRADKQRGKRDMVCCSPPQVPILHAVVLDADLAQRLDCWDCSQKGGIQRIKHCGEDFPTVLSHHFSRSSSDVVRRLSSMRCP